MDLYIYEIKLAIYIILKLYRIFCKILINIYKKIYKISEI